MILDPVKLLTSTNYHSVSHRTTHISRVCKERAWSLTKLMWCGLWCVPVSYYHPAYDNCIHVILIACLQIPTQELELSHDRNMFVMEYNVWLKIFRTALRYHVKLSSLHGSLPCWQRLHRRCWRLFSLFLDLLLSLSPFTDVNPY